MAVQLNPYVNFKDNAREAMEFYHDVFGGSLTLSTFGEYGMNDAGIADKIMHAQLQGDNGVTLMAADTPPEMEHTPGNTATLSLSGDDADLLRGYWARLSDGGQVSAPLEMQMWGDEFGMCNDRFGIPWMVNITTPQA